MKIGHGAIIAAGAVVTKDVSDYTIFGDVPAKVIRQIFSNDICQRLLHSEWWDIHWKLLKRINFEDIEDALKQIESIKSTSEIKKVDLHLSNHQSCSLVENQLNDLIKRGLDGFKLKGFCS